MTVLSIIIPTFNAEEEIEACISSISDNLSCYLSNDVVNVIIKDGGSTDSTEYKVMSLLKKFKWLHYSSSKDNGVYDAMNQSITFSHSKWVYFLGSDDRILPEFASIFKILSKDESASSIHCFNVKLANGIYYNSSFNIFKLLKNNICHQGVIYPRTLLIKNPYNILYKALSDWYINIKLFKYFHFYTNVIAFYNDQSGLSSTFYDAKFLQDKPRIFFNNHGCFLGTLAYIYFLKSVIKRAFSK